MLTNAASSPSPGVNVLLFQRRFAEALRVAEGLPDKTFAPENYGLHSKYLFIGIAQKGLADDAGAREAFLKAKEIAQKQIAEGPDDARRRATLAGILAWLGEKDTVLAEAQRAVELLPESKDAFEGPVITESLAEVHAILGNSNEAIEILDGLLTRPSEVTVETLKLNPVWDSLRGNPGFAEMLARHGAKA